MKEAEFCSPSKKGKKSGTCFSKKTLLKMATTINPNKNWKNKTKMQLWDIIREDMSEKCDTEWCWLEKDERFKNILTSEELGNTFKPKKPKKWKKNKYAWLSTSDINKVMKQYEKKYKDYVFFGPVPVDCPNGYFCELSNLEIKKMYKSGIKRIGIIYNLDKHYQKGSHWVAVYITMKSIKKPQIIYYDSYGEPPPKQIKMFIESVKCKIKNIKNSGEPIIINTEKRHQYGHSECGVFSMTYILLSLYGLTHEKIISGKLMTDKLMNALRNHMYRP